MIIKSQFSDRMTMHNYLCDINIMIVFAHIGAIGSPVKS